MNFKKISLTKLTPKLCFLFLAVLFLPFSEVRGQEAIRIARQSGAISEGLGNSGGYNIKMGPVQAKLQAKLGLEYNDNIAFADRSIGQKAFSDFIITPELNLGIRIPVGKGGANSLYFDTGIGYRKYLDHNSADSSFALVAPNTELGLNFIIARDFTLNIHDRFQYRQDPIDSNVLPNVTNDQFVDYGVYTNTLGARITGNFNDVILTLGYDNFKTWASKSVFDTIDRTSNIFYGSVGVKVAPRLEVGIDGSYSDNQFDRDFNNNSSSYTGGGFINWNTSDSLRAKVSAGYTTNRFATNGTNLDTSRDASGVYGDLTLTHRLNRYITHSLSFGSAMDLGISNNANQAYYARHTGHYDIIRSVGLGTEAFIDLSDPTGGAYGDHAMQWGAGVYASYSPMKKLRATLGYRHIARDSETYGRDYYQNRVYLDLLYSF